MGIASPVLTGRHVRLEPLEPLHVEGLVLASADDRGLYQWSAVPRGESAVRAYVETAISWREAGTAVPFATVRVSDGAIIGSTRFWKIERWAWPAGHPRREGPAADVLEIGHTWLARESIRTAANTEAKAMMLTHAFEVWGVLRVSFHTDARNERSAAALARIGGRFEGVLRSHRMASDFTPRDSKRFSIVAAEWPEVKHRLIQILAYPGPEPHLEQRSDFC